MSLDSPSPPDPAATAQAQQGFNENAARYQAETNMVNQSTPYGSLTYRQTGTNPDGSPIFSSTTQLSPAEQKLFDTGLGTQQTMAGEASQLASSLGPSLSHGPNIGNDSLINTLMGWQSKYMQPIFSQQQSNLNSQLASEGITQGSTAYDNAQRGLNQSQTGSMENAMASDEGQAFNQSAQAYQLPLQTLATLLNGSQPGNLNSSFTQTPQEQIQPANYESLAQQDYQSQLQNQQNSMAGIFGIGSALAGGWARAGFPGLTPL